MRFREMYLTRLAHDKIVDAEELRDGRKRARVPGCRVSSMSSCNAVELDDIVEEGDIFLATIHSL